MILHSPRTGTPTAPQRHRTLVLAPDPRRAPDSPPTAHRDPQDAPVWFDVRPVTGPHNADVTDCDDPTALFGVYRLDHAAREWTWLADFHDLPAALDYAAQHGQPIMVTSADPRECREPAYPTRTGDAR